MISKFLPIDPESTWKQSWDALIMLFLLYTTFSVPYMLAIVSDSESSGPLTPFEINEIILDTPFGLDILLSWVTAYSRHGMYEKRMGQIAMQYVTTWFFLDFFGSVPFDKIATAVLDGGDQFGPTLKIMKIARILKMIRAVRFVDKRKQLEQKDASGALKTILKVFRSIFLMVLVAYFLGCIFVMVIDLSPEPFNWIERYDPSLLDAPNEQKYIAALYWTRRIDSRTSCTRSTSISSTARSPSPPGLTRRSPQINNATNLYRGHTTSPRA